MANENFERIDTLQGAFFTYVIGHFKNPDVHVIGTMDLNDLSARDGGESETVFYFMITPEEFAWYQDDRQKLEDLAQLIQIRMPKSRFFAALSQNKIDPKEMQSLIQRTLGDEKLDNDTEFENWAAGLRERIAQKAAAQQAAKERANRVPASPLNEARHTLAVHQLQIRTRDKAIGDARKKLAGLEADSQEYKDCEAWIKTAVEGRNAEAQKGKELEDALGNRIFTSTAIFAAMDTCWKPGLPMINAATGMVCIFTTQEIADHYVELVTKNHQLFPVVHKIERNNIKNFLRMLEMTGVITLLVDDGTEPVRILLKNIIPRLDRGYIEAHNAGIRGLVVRNMQVSAALQKHGSEMEEEWRLTLNDQRATLDRNMLQEFGNTVFFVPCGIPEKDAKRFKGNYVYTEQANTKIHELCAKEKLTQPSMARPGFTGGHIVLQGNVNLPLRLVNVNESKRMLLSFTSREEAMTFIEVNKDMKNDTIIAISMDEMQKIAAQVDGVLVDPQSFMMTLNQEIIDKAISIRGEKKLIFNHHLNKKNDESSSAPEEK